MNSNVKSLIARLVLLTTGREVYDKEAFFETLSESSADYDFQNALSKIVYGLEAEANKKNTPYSVVRIVKDEVVLAREYESQTKANEDALQMIRDDLGDEYFQDDAVSASFDKETTAVLEENGVYEDRDGHKTVVIMSYSQLPIS